MTGRAGALSRLPLWLVLTGLAGGAYLAVSAAGGGAAGFPLDDAWIHQTYAHNLGTAGEWAFLPGHTSAGSTAPLWSLLLSLGYRLSLPPLAWTYALGVVALGATAWLAAGLAADFFPGRSFVAWLAGLLCVAEWHMVWAAVSGMETALYACLALAVVRLAYDTPHHVSTRSQWICGPRPGPPDCKSGGSVEGSMLAPRLSFDICHLRFALLGFVGGLLVLTRPEGLVLIGLAALATGWQLRRDARRLLVGWAALALGLALPLAPYLAFHYSTTGLPFPNTFYAKQQEYRALLELYPLWQRWPAMAGVTLVGAGVLLVPGFVFAVVRSLRRGDGRRRGILLLAAWWLVHLTLYALWLPVTYQHGRYQMPVIPAFLLIGVGGTAALVDAVRHPLFGRVLRRVAVAATGLVCVVFLAVGARAFASDVGFVQGEMVATARWLADNAPADSLIAVHDIGAVGYFAPRRLLDLAGLVTPQVIPFITDEALLMAFMRSQGADYVVFFPDWSAAYGRMARDPRLELVHTTGYAWTREQGRANMAVYRFDRTLQ